MHITKLWHCCLLIDTKWKRLLTDPGCFTIEAHENLRDLDAILFTHEHTDHFHLESLKTLLKNNPDVTIFCNTSVADLLEKENIEHTIICDGETVDFEGITISGYGVEHAEIHSSISRSANTGFFFANRFFYPGDAYTNPNVDVEILALPVSWPWVKIGDAIDYALTITPKVAFPVHDHFYFSGSHVAPANILPQNGIEFIPLKAWEGHDFW